MIYLPANFSHLCRGAARCAPTWRHFRFSGLFFLPLLAFQPLFPPGALAQRKGQPILQVSYPDYQYSDALSSLGKLNLRNARVAVFDEKGSVEMRAHLHEGKYEEKWEVGGAYVGLAWQRLLRNQSGEPQYAIADLHYVFLGRQRQ